MRAAESNVLKLIGGFDKVFIIPPFQRNYEWSYEQCDELFRDIVKSYRNDKTHYLGNVVYYVGENDGASYDEHILVDGQQRITTILLLLCAIRDVANDESTTDSINKRYLKNDTSESRFRIRLKQTSYDSESFMAIIDKRQIENENNITQNYKHFLKLLKECDVSTKDIYDTITKLEIVDVNLKIENDLEAVQTVFEKINSTGKRLTPADLIRNYLLLASNSEVQERLYKDYWVKIEQKVKNENISRFARDYLVMNIFDDVVEEKIYIMFKEHFSNTDIQHIDILSDMSRYSQIYGWIKYETCPDKKINKTIKLLNFLKTDDVYPLYLFLFDSLYESNRDELLIILELLSDFMMRYRIVSPSGGGGALRSVVQQLLEKLSSNIIKLNYDSIYLELSNSHTPSGRFPDDDEFKESLMEAVNTRYARAVLIKIEESERCNIPIPLNKVTIEHLMPRKLNNWWKENLGGDTESERIYNKYIDCIGNLAPISREYNSKNSNKPWTEKVRYIKDVQFVITAETAKQSIWNEDSIIKRNKDIANRACLAVTSPLERTRKYQTRKTSEEFEPGVYPVSDITTSMAGAVLDSILYENQVIRVSTWKKYINIICEMLYEIDNGLFKEAVDSNIIHKATSTRNYPEKDPIITINQNKLVEAVPIGETDYYSEGALSSDRARIYAKQLLDLYGLTDRFEINVNTRS